MTALEPIVLPLVPLRDVAASPNLTLPVRVGRAESIAAVSAAMGGDRDVVLCMQRSDAESISGIDDLHATGVIAKITRVGTGGPPLGLVLQCLTRVRLEDVRLVDKSHWMATVRPAPLGPSPVSPEKVEALMAQVRETIDRYLAASEASYDGGVISLDPAVVADPVVLGDVLVVLPDLSAETRQAMLDADDPFERLRLGYLELSRLVEVMRIRRHISEEVSSDIANNQRRYILREQLRTIQRELDEADGQGNGGEPSLRERITTLGLPPVVHDRAMREVDRLDSIPPGSPELGIVRGYLDWLMELPWKAETTDDLDLVAASRILDEDHWGLDTAKQRILEYLAVRKLAPNVKSPILCLVGPPGAGKTSLGRSVARAMGREFIRLSLGGMHDEAEIRGHRRTYIGAMPGRILQQLKVAGVRNPVFMLDEIDKLGSGWRGDPASALLEVLDPVQNDTFADNYLEVPFDLSHVLFMTTANLIDQVPPPLRDRMEILTLSGYTPNEKLVIATRYLLPRQLVNHGLPAAGQLLTDEAIGEIVSGYTREAGVRSLDREISAVLRKVARVVAEGGEPPTSVARSDIGRLLGPRHFDDGELAREARVGTASGLVVTVGGGDVVDIEVIPRPSGGELILTGQLGDVMKESARAALSYVQANAARLGIPAEMAERGVHVHVPAGAVPKDGPSAGVTMVVAMASALSGRPIRHDLAMTGEVTLRGQVLPVGGVKAKVLAAHRAGARTVVLPARNERDLLEDLPVEVREAIEIRLVNHVDEALGMALLERPVSPSAIRV